MSKLTQVDQVIAAMKRLGGIASLSQLIGAVDFSQWGTKTPDATIRQTVQNKSRFSRIKPGVYCLPTLRDKFIAKYDETVDDAKQQMSNHSYYQGLLLQWGRTKDGIQTYAPPQDRNKRFLEAETLRERTDYDVLPPFGYDRILRKAKTVDVIWFNRRKMPSAFYEVEMTTGMKNSLGKFHELQDFHARFVIVAPESRRGSFDDIVSEDLYYDIRKRVEFLPTEKIEAKFERDAREAGGLIVR